VTLFIYLLNILFIERFSRAWVARLVRALLFDLLHEVMWVRIPLQASRDNVSIRTITRKYIYVHHRCMNWKIIKLGGQCGLWFTHWYIPTMLIIQIVGYTSRELEDFCGSWFTQNETTSPLFFQEQTAAAMEHAPLLRKMNINVIIIVIKNILIKNLM